ncbi:Translation initiation factor eIF-2B subunit delta, partial [Auxenochlorella protothecoides]
LFAHLPRHHEVDVAGVVARGTAAALPLPAIQLGLTLAQGSLRGANARCIAMLDVFRQVVLEFRSAGGREFARELNPLLNSVISFLVFCRPLSVSMGAAIKHVKAAVEKLKLEPSAKERLLGVISSFVQEKILFAGDHLAGEAAKRIQSDDVVLTYGYSSVVAAVLLRAAAAGTPFAVVVADARPLLEGRRMLRALLAARVPAQYVALNGLSFVLPRVTKVLLGAGAVLSNGAVLARAGSAAVAMAASAAHVPVLVAAETYKFHERVQLDSITHNELGDPDLLVEMPGGEKAWLEGWREQEGLGLLSLMYDTMPAQFVSMVITEVGAIPPTSVPVILREQRADGNMA